ncbi:MAG: hypothetical protein ACE3JQ_02515 [Paenisporosarcina sp.]
MKQAIIGQKIGISNEVIRQSYINDLMNLGVINGTKGERLRDMDYYSLRNLLAVERIKRGETM